MIYVPGTLTKNELKERLFKRTIVEDGHWLYKGGKTQSGYGLYGNQRVHRLSMWIYHDFDVKCEYLVLHKCDIRNCWNPEHLFIGTQYDNVRDAINKGRAVIWSANHGGAIVERNRTNCPKGHLLDGKRGNGKRYCLTCNRERA